MTVAANGGERISLSFFEGIYNEKIKKVMCAGVGNIDSLQATPWIEELVLTPKNGEVLDVGVFSNLCRLDTDNIQSFINRDKLNLLHFGTGIPNFDFTELLPYTQLESLLFYGVKTFSFDKIKCFTKLKEINARVLTITDLRGIEKLEELQGLSLLYCRILSDLSGIGTLRKLTGMLLANCPKVTDISEIAKCVNLEELELNSLKNIDVSVLSNANNLGKLMLSNCGSVSSLRFISLMTNLEFLSFVDTNIIDGDLSPCLNLKYVGTLNKKHYNIKADMLPNQKTRFHPQRAEIENPIEIIFSAN
jgi:hypothetical protein